MDVSDAIKVMEMSEEENRDEFLRDGRNVYLRIPLDEGFETGYSFRMVSGVQPACLLPVGIVREAHQVYADYLISGWTALSSVPSEDLLNLLYGFVNALKNAADELADCLLSAEELSLEPRHIFLRRETGEIRFCYLFEGIKPFGESLQGLMEYFIKTAKPAREQDVLLLYGLYQKSREENVTPEILASFRTELLNGQTASVQENRPEGNARSGEVPWFEGTEGAGPAKATEFSVEDEETRELYERLGMEAEDQNSSFARWKKEKKRAVKPEPAKKARPEPEEIPVREISDGEVKPQPFFRKHLPEILIGAAAVILAICALVL